MQTLFDADGITRRDWRMLNLLAGEARDERLAERLHSKPHALHHLAERGWIAGAPPVLTEAGREARDRLEVQVRALRERVAGAVSAEDFATTLRSLEAIARELGWDESDPMPRGHRGGRRHGFGGHRFGGGHGFGGWHGAGKGHAFGHHPGFGEQPGRQDVHVHVHLHDDDRRQGRGHRATAATAVTTGTPRPDHADPQPGALDRVAPGCAVRGPPPPGDRHRTSRRSTDAARRTPCTTVPATSRDRSRACGSARRS